MQTVILLAAGFVFGIIASMGLGGGNILIPLLLLTGLPFDSARFICIAAFAMLSPFSHGETAPVRLILCGVAGAIGGTVLSFIINQDVIKTAYGAFALFTGLMQIIQALPRIIKNKKSLKRK